MCPITLYFVFKYLAITRPLTLLTFRKTSKNRRFLAGIFQSRPVFGQNRPDGWSDRQNFHFKTDGIKFLFDPYTIHAYPMRQFLKVSGHAYRQTNKQTS